MVAEGLELFLDENFHANHQRCLVMKRNSVVSEPFASFLKDIEALGVRASPEGGEVFALIGARSNPRWWLTPLDRGGECARAGLDMFQPVTRGAKLAKSAMRLCARHAPAALPGGRLRLAGAPSFLRVFSEADLCCAYFTGTAGPHRKTAVQIMTRSGEIVGYAKISRDPAVKTYLENEARVLNEIAGLGLACVETPRLLEWCKGDGNAAWVVTDSLRAPGQSVLLGLGAPHYAFLAELATKTARLGEGGATLAALCREVETLSPRLEGEWVARIEEGVKHVTKVVASLPVVMAHGDFTPWNSFLAGDRLYVFDWEYAHPVYPLGYDEIHFTLATGLVEAPTKLITGLETALAARWYDGDQARAAQVILFSLLLHAVFYLGRVIAAGGSARDWEEAPRRAAMIDALLARAGE